MSIATQDENPVQTRKLLTHAELCGFPIFQFCKLTDEYWGASVGGNKEQLVAFVLVPRSALALSNEELGKRVRAYEILVEEAAAQHIIELVNHCGVDNVTIEELSKWRQTLSTLQLSAHKEVLAIIDDRIQRLTELPFRRQHVKDERKAIRLDYDKTFMQLGRAHGFKCGNCGSCHDLQVDHVVPLIDGGTNEYTNLQLVCQSCNSTKGAKTIDYRKVGGGQV